MLGHDAHRREHQDRGTGVEVRAADANVTDDGVAVNSDEREIFDHSHSALGA
jgi:hypothetical protein